MAGNPPVLSVWIDRVQALRSHGVDAHEIVASIVISSATTSALPERLAAHASG